MVPSRAVCPTDHLKFYLYPQHQNQQRAVLLDTATASRAVCAVFISCATFQPTHLFHPISPPLTLFPLFLSVHRTLLSLSALRMDLYKLSKTNGKKMEFKPRNHVAPACLLVVIAAVRTGSAQPILGSIDSNRTGARHERYHLNSNGMFTNATPFLWLIPFASCGDRLVTVM